MSLSQPPVSPDQIAALPPKFRALLEAVIGQFEQRIAGLVAELATVKAELATTTAELAKAKAELAAAKRTPRNSSVPPSTEHPHAKPKWQRPRSRKKRGGQPGHQKYDRPLIPTQDCQSVEALKPADCRRCGESLTGSDLAPLRHQVREIPEIKPLVTEYQLHRLICPCCSASTCAELPAGVPQIQAGPRLVALAALLMGCFKQSKRRVALFLEQELNQPCSPGWVVKLQNQATAALTPADAELARSLPAERVRESTNRPRKKPGSNRGCGRSSPASSRSLRCAPPGPRRFCSNC